MHPVAQSAIIGTCALLGVKGANMFWPVQIDVDELKETTLATDWDTLDPAKIAKAYIGTASDNLNVQISREVGKRVFLGIMAGTLVGVLIVGIMS
jgi:ABC-type phosphate transport system auxiliary subunit